MWMTTAGALDCGIFDRGLQVMASRFQQEVLANTKEECRAFCEGTSTGVHNDACVFHMDSGRCTLHSGPIQHVTGGDYAYYFAWCRSTFQFGAGGTPIMGCVPVVDLMAENWWCQDLSPTPSTGHTDCRSKCCYDPQCVTWQYGSGQCWTGSSTVCKDRGSTPLVAGGMIDRRSTQTILFYPDSDATIAHDTQYSNCNYGKTNNLQCGVYDSHTIARSLLKFALSLPPQYVVEEATMTLQTLYWRHKRQLLDVNVNVHKVFRPWREGSGGPDLVNGGLTVTWRSPPSTATTTHTKQAQGLAFLVAAPTKLLEVTVAVPSGVDTSQFQARLLRAAGPPSEAELQASDVTELAGAARAAHIESWVTFTFEEAEVLDPLSVYLLLVDYGDTAPHPTLYTQASLLPSYPVTSASARSCGVFGDSPIVADTQALHMHMQFELLGTQGRGMCEAADGATGVDRGPFSPWGALGVGLDGVDASQTPVSSSAKKFSELSAETQGAWMLGGADGSYTYPIPSPPWSDPENPQDFPSAYPSDVDFLYWSRWDFNLIHTVRQWSPTPPTAVANKCDTSAFCVDPASLSPVAQPAQTCTHPDSPGWRTLTWRGEVPQGRGSGGRFFVWPFCAFRPLPFS